MTEVTRMRWPVFQLINVILRILAIVYVLMETKNRPNDIKLSPPVSKTIVSYSIRGEISSDFFAFFTKTA